MPFGGFAQQSRDPAPPRSVIVVGGGPSGLTAALLLARAGHRVKVLEASDQLGGLWACRLDAEGHFESENSCKVYQSTYHTAPALFEMLGTTWVDHFSPRHDLTTGWLKPFVKACTWADLAKLGASFLLNRLHLRSYRDVSVEEYLDANRMSAGCRAWMRATALGGIAGTLRMTIWELFHRLGGNVASIFSGAEGGLFWNQQPPNGTDGFVAPWKRALRELGVSVAMSSPALALHPDGDRVAVELVGGQRVAADAVFLALPPRPMATLLTASHPSIAAGFGHPADRIAPVLLDSVYEHLGLCWFFDRPLPNDLPLGGHNVRSGWHPILVQHSQYKGHLPPNAVTVVTGSVSVATDFRHPRLGTLAADHAPADLGRILWDDERSVDPSLPEPIRITSYGMSCATQVVGHGPLPVRATTAPVFVATSLNGLAPYFTASLESAMQAGAAAAAAFDPAVERLPTGPVRNPSPWFRKKTAIRGPAMAARSSS